MPIMQLHLPEGVCDDAAVAKLLVEASEFYCDIFYPQVTPRPIERVRAFVAALEAWVIGALARSGTEAAQGAFVMTSRVSIELVQKCALAGCGMLIAVSAPTARAGIKITRAKAGAAKRRRRKVKHRVRCLPGTV